MIACVFIIKKKINYFDPLPPLSIAFVTSFHMSFADAFVFAFITICQTVVLFDVFVVLLVLDPDDGRLAPLFTASSHFLLYSTPAFNAFSSFCLAISSSILVISAAWRIMLLASAKASSFAFSSSSSLRVSSSVAFCAWKSANSFSSITFFSALSLRSFSVGLSFASSSACAIASGVVFCDPRASSFSSDALFSADSSWFFNSSFTATTLSAILSFVPLSRSAILSLVLFILSS